MKNRPRNSPRNGRMSASIWCRYSLSASISPARKAPSAIDMPACSVAQPVPSATKIEVAANSSGFRVPAISRKTSRTMNRPTNAITASTTTAFTAARPSTCGSPSTAPASSGSSTRNGTTARSWNSKTPIEARPCRAVTSPRSTRCCRTAAVEDSASAPPSTKAATAPPPMASAINPMTSDVSATWARPNPKMKRRMAINRAQGRSSPTANSRKTTPNSASSRAWPGSVISPMPCGPIARPAAR